MCALKLTHLRQRELCVFISHSLLLLTENILKWIDSMASRLCALAQKRNDTQHSTALPIRTRNYMNSLLFLSSSLVVLLRLFTFRREEKKSVHYSIINWLFVFIVSMDAKWIENEKKSMYLNECIDEYDNKNDVDEVYFKSHRYHSQPLWQNEKKLRFLVRWSTLQNEVQNVEMKMKWNLVRPGETW